MKVDRIHQFSCLFVLFFALILIIARRKYKDHVPFITQHDCLKLQRCHLSKNCEISAKVSLVGEFMISCFILSCFD